MLLNALQNGLYIAGQELSNIGHWSDSARLDQGLALVHPEYSCIDERTSNPVNILGRNWNLAKCFLLRWDVKEFKNRFAHDSILADGGCSQAQISERAPDGAKSIWDAGLNRVTRTAVPPR